jgi:hypothetical protein
MADKPTSTSGRDLGKVQTSVSGRDLGKVQSAARNTPLPPSARRVTGEHLAIATKDTALNVAGLLRDLLDDFKSSDRYFKYKALVVVCWLGLAVTSVGVACPSTGATNSIGARLVIAGEASSPIYMVKNDSPTAWQDVEVLVNGTYRSTSSQVDPNRDITLSPVVLYDSTGNRAPGNLKITDITVQVGADDKATLFENGAAK